MHSFFNNWAVSSRYRKPLLMFSDFLLFTISYFTAWLVLMRRIPLAQHAHTMWLGFVFFIIIFFVTFWAFGMYESLWRYAEAYEFFKCMLATMVATVIFVAFTWVWFSSLLGIGSQTDMQRVPITVYFLSSLMAGGSTLFLRTAYRAYRSTRHGRKVSAGTKKVLVVGADAVGVSVIQGLQRSSVHRYEVVCAVDDDPSKQGRRIQRVRVAGTVRDIPRLVDKHGIQVILLAMPNASGKEKRFITSICQKTACTLKKIPDMFDFVADDSPAEVISRIDDVSLEDLLGRDVVDVQRFKSKFLAGKTVLVTGAGGTIGAELCCQAAAHGAQRLIMLDVVENGMYAVQQTLLYKHGYNYPLFAEVASVRDEAKLDILFAHYKPDIVYHAAAHKHVPLMEAAPDEAVKNNILGTLNIARAADRHNVDRFVLISSDKAVNPTSTYGATKRVCEMIVQSINASSLTEFVAVRFGNVLGSNGSVVPLFKAQIEAGGPVRVTHAEINRYYMTDKEAVSLVLAAGEMAVGGEIFVLDMGDPVKTLDLAELLIRLSGYEPYKEIPIEFTGLRPGEKLYEELLMAEEGLQKTSNNKIFVGKPIDVEPEYLFNSLNILKQAIDANDIPALMDELLTLVPGFHTVRES